MSSKTLVAIVAALALLAIPGASAAGLDDDGARMNCSKPVVVPDFVAQIVYDTCVFISDTCDSAFTNGCIIK